MVNRQNIIHHLISIFLWNANGLLHHKKELSAFLILNSIDILLINEAHLTPNSSFKFSSYLTYQCDHPDGLVHTSSAILIKPNIKHTTLLLYQNNCIQATNIALTLNHIPIIISSAYFHPGKKISTDELSRYFTSLGNHFLMGSDFNSKHLRWGFSSPNTKDQMLNKFLLNDNLKIISPSNPTYWPSHANRQHGSLEFFITSLPGHIKYTISNLSDLSFDHIPLLLTLNKLSTSTTVHPTLTPGKTNWKKFSENIDSQISLNILLNIPLDL